MNPNDFAVAPVEHTKGDWFMHREESGDACVIGANDGASEAINLKTPRINIVSEAPVMEPRSRTLRQANWLTQTVEVGLAQYLTCDAHDKLTGQQFPTATATRAWGFG